MTGPDGRPSGDAPAPTPLPRVRVSAPRSDAASALPTVPLAAATSDLAGIYVRSLIRSQLRLALVFALGFVVATVLFVVALVVLPLDTTLLAGVPMSWLLLGVGVYPLIFTVAWLFVRLANRNETRYRALAEAS